MDSFGITSRLRMIGAHLVQMRIKFNDGDEKTTTKFGEWTVTRMAPREYTHASEQCLAFLNRIAEGTRPHSGWRGLKRAHSKNFSRENRGRAVAIVYLRLYPIEK